VLLLLLRDVMVGAPGHSQNWMLNGEPSPGGAGCNTAWRPPGPRVGSVRFKASLDRCLPLVSLTGLRLPAAGLERPGGSKSLAGILVLPQATAAGNTFFCFAFTAIVLGSPV